MVNVRYLTDSGAILEASFGDVATPGAGEAVVDVDVMPRTQFIGATVIWLDMIQDGQVVARLQAEIDAEIASIEQRTADTDAATGGARAWYDAHPNASLLFTLSIDDLQAEMDSLDLSALPAGTAAKLRLLLMTLSVEARVLARKEGFI